MLAGCAYPCETTPPVTARIVPADAPATGGSGPAALAVRILDGPGGQGLPSAAVVFYWADDAVSENRDEMGRVEVGPDRVVVEPGARAATPLARYVVALRTDAAGVAVAHLPADRFVGIVAAADGRTEEWIAHVATTPGRTELAIPLYRTRLAFDLEGTWGPGGASTAFVTGGGTVWQPQAIPFPEGSSKGYAARIVGLNATLRWENQATAFGNLAVGIGPTTGSGPTVVREESPNVAAGAQKEEARLAVVELHEHSILGAAQILVGPASQSAYVAPLGMPYTLHVEMEFDRARADFEGCLYRGEAQSDSGGWGVGAPAWGLAGAVGALLVATWVRRK